VTWENWAKVPKYEPKKAEAAAEEVEKVPEVLNATRFVVMPGPFRRAIPLDEAVREVNLAGDLPHGLRCEYGIIAGIFQLNVFGSEETTKQTPRPRGVAQKRLTDFKQLTVPISTKIQKSSETPLDEFYAWAQRVPASFLGEPVPARILRQTQANLGNVPLYALAKRWELRKGKYTAHGLLPGLALDVAKAARHAKSTITPELLEEFRRLRHRGRGQDYINKAMGISEHEYDMLLEMDSAGSAHGARGES
jgi:hypothetical protein